MLRKSFTPASDSHDLVWRSWRRERRHGLCRPVLPCVRAQRHRRTGPAAIIAVLGKSGGPHPKQAPGAPQSPQNARYRRYVLRHSCARAASPSSSRCCRYAGRQGRILTACYILIVRWVGLLFGRRCGVKHWCGVALAMAGLYFLCMTGGSFPGFAMGDLIDSVVCAAVLHPYRVIRPFSPMVTAKMSCIQFSSVRSYPGIGMLIFEQPSFPNILAAWKPILYAGAMSSGVGYTLQIVGQKGMNPAVASLIA